MVQFKIVHKMRWMVFFLTSVLTFFTLIVADQYDTQTYSDPYPPQHDFRRQDFDLFADGAPLGLIGVGAIAGIIAGGVAVAQAANARTEIQNDINTLSTSSNTLQTNADTITNTLTTAQMTSVTDSSRATAICGLVTNIGALEVDNTMLGEAINGIIEAGMNVIC